jgi:hypothetical protein
VKDSDVLSLTSTLPVSWVTFTGGGYAEGVTSTSTSWIGRVRYGVSVHGSQGSLTVHASNLATPQAQSDFLVLVIE